MEQAPPQNDVWPRPYLTVIENIVRKPKILTPDFRYDIVMAIAEDGEAEAGPFLPQAIRNLEQKRCYQFLFMGLLQQSEAHNQRFLTLVPPHLHCYCSFVARRAPSSLVGIFIRTVAELKREEAMVYEYIRKGIDDDGWVDISCPLQRIFMTF